MLLMGKSTISMAIFNSYVKLPEGSWANPLTGHGFHSELSTGMENGDGDHRDVGQNQESFLSHMGTLWYI